MEYLALTAVFSVLCLLIYFGVRIGNFTLRALHLQQKQVVEREVFNQKIFEHLIANLDTYYGQAFDRSYQLSDPALVRAGRQKVAEVASKQADNETINTIMNSGKDTLRPAFSFSRLSTLPPEMNDVAE